MKSIVRIVQLIFVMSSKQTFVSFITIAVEIYYVKSQLLYTKTYTRHSLYQMKAKNSMTKVTYWYNFLNNYYYRIPKAIFAYRDIRSFVHTGVQTILTSVSFTSGRSSR